MMPTSPTGTIHTKAPSPGAITTALAAGEAEENDELAAVDLGLVIDTTGSMSNVLAAAKTLLVSLVARLAEAAEVRLRVGVVEYRDHPQQEHSFVTRVHPLTFDLAGRVQYTIAGLVAHGGGDVPEAVYDGVAAACRQLEWGRHARRLLLLVGDAPPHETGDATFPSGCPCGLTAESTAALCEEAGITLFSVGLTVTVAAPFGRLATMTGGRFFPAGQASEAIGWIGQVLLSEFGSLDLDRRVFAAAREEPAISLDALGERIGEPRPAIVASWVRLVSRGLLAAPQQQAGEVRP